MIKLSLILSLLLSLPHEVEQDHYRGVMYDVGGTWVTDVSLAPGVVLSIPHTPLLDPVINGGYPLPPTDPVPAVVGTHHCWLVPYGPPNPDGSWPLQAMTVEIFGEGETLEHAVVDYKSQVNALIKSGAVPNPGGCDPG